MTRINCVPVGTLHQKHLVAEYRELPRVHAQRWPAHTNVPDMLRLPEQWRRGWTPDDQALRINAERIADRMPA